MKRFAVIIGVILATFSATVLAIDQSPMDGIPYCVPVTDGIFHDMYGVPGSYPNYACDTYVAVAIFHNGQDSGYNATDTLIVQNRDNFWSFNYVNNTEYVPQMTGVLWDLGTDNCNGGYGIIDGMNDAYDGALSFQIDGTSVGGDYNLTTTCGARSVSFSPMPASYGLMVERTFYFAEGNQVNHIIVENSF